MTTTLERGTPPPSEPPTDRLDRTPAPIGEPSARNRVIERVSVVLLLAGTLIGYLINLSANGWANSFYTAAIQAGSESWKAWFFGSSDMANSITVDKPPASLWIPALSVRVFGLNPWSVLVPEVLMGVASVGLLYLITRRYFGHWAGIGAGAVLALTPVAALMFRFDNPEALLLLLMIAAAGATMKAVETGKLRWMVLTGVAVGFGFLTKQLQVVLIVPALAAGYFAFGPGTWLKRLGHCFAALGAMIVSAGWWLLTVELWPADSRPYIGGSQNNSILELTLGYNGLGRLNGNEEGAVVPGGGGAGGTGYGMAGGGMGGPGGGNGGGMWGEAGFWRMFEPEQGGQIAWLIPTALIFAVAAPIVIGRAPRTDRRRAYLLIFGAWMLTTMVVFSYMQGIFHSYYTAAIAPPLAGLVAASASVLWREREKLWVALTLAAGAAVAAVWGFVLLGRSADFLPWLRWVVLVAGLAAAVALIFVRRGSVSKVVAGVAVAAALAGPTAYTVDTIASSTQGSIVSAGPRVAGGFGPGGGPGGGGPGGPGGMRDGGQGRQAPPGMAGQDGQGGTGGQTPGGFPGGMTPPGGAAGGMPGQADGGYGRGGGMGGLLMGSDPSDEVVATLSVDADSYTWVAAALGSNQASGFQIATGYSVMPIGGFNGSDPSPTLEQFQKYVEDGKIHYFIASGGMGGPGGGQGTGSQISEWVTENFESAEVDGVTMYDLTTPKDS